jgi:hypothetical protein
VFCLVCYVASKVASNNHMPEQVNTRVKSVHTLAICNITFHGDVSIWKTHHVGPCFRSNSFLMYAATSCHQFHNSQCTFSIDKHSQPFLCSYLLNVVIRQCLACRIDRILLHFLVHIRILDDGLSLLTHLSVALVAINNE